MAPCSLPFRILMLGPPGSGKGTQAALLAELWNVPHISTGEIIRAEVASNSKRGRKLAVTLAAGDLVEDSLILEIISDRLSTCGPDSGFILDGAIRTVPQAEELARILAVKGCKLRAVVYLSVPESELLDRIANRVRKAVAAGAEVRPDDTPEVARHRLEVYLRQTSPVVEYYRKAGILIEVRGVGPREEVTSQILTAIESLSPVIS